MDIPVDIAKISDAKAVAKKLSELPTNALIYIAGFVDGCYEQPQNQCEKSIQEARSANIKVPQTEGVKE